MTHLLLEAVLLAIFQTIVGLMLGVLFARRIERWLRNNIPNHARSFLGSLRARIRARKDKQIREASGFATLIAAAYAHGFRTYPEGTALCESRYLSRERVGEENPHEKPLYHYFVEGVELEEFRGFLVPPLDAGHTELAAREGIKKLSRNWKTYLDGLNRKALEARERIAKRQGRGLESVPAIGRRIVLFDKFLIDLFLAEMACSATLRHNIIGPGRNGQSKELERLLRVAEIIAYDTWSIHKLGHKAIECIYLDKARIQTNQYYDFGLYATGSARAVYNPIFAKDINKAITEERLFISDVHRHSREIAEFARDFDELWREGQHEISRYPTNQESDRWAYDPAMFQEAYGVRLEDHFRDVNGD